MKKVLFVGESWSATLMEVKGFNSFLSSKYETGLGWIDKAIEKAGYEFVYMPNHIANDHFPFTLEELNEYSCIILSDVGADTLLIPSATFAEVTLPDHPAFAGIEGEWPPVLGYNKSTIKPEAELAATVCGDPFIAFGSYGEGKSAVFSSDCSPHWAPPEFCNWKYYDVLFKNILDYIAK